MIIIFTFFSDLAGKFPTLPMFMAAGTLLPLGLKREMGFSGPGKVHIVALLAKSFRNIRDKRTLDLLFVQRKMFNKLSQSPYFRLDNSRKPFSGMAIHAIGMRVFRSRRDPASIRSFHFMTGAAK